MHNPKEQPSQEDIERFRHVAFHLSVNGRHLVIRTERRVLTVAKTTDVSQTAGGIDEVVAGKASSLEPTTHDWLSLMLKAFERGRHRISARLERLCQPDSHRIADGALRRRPVQSRRISRMAKHPHVIQAV